jgi:alpha-beta hydrolase superfamily lysophospholipase
MHSPTAAERAKESHLPILIFHGKEDKFVPTQCSINIANAVGDRAKLILIDDAAHAECVYYATDLYKKELIEFLNSNMI